MNPKSAVIREYTPRGMAAPRVQFPIASRENLFAAGWEYCRATWFRRSATLKAYVFVRNATAHDRSVAVMAIDKDSSGLPEVDFSKRTTKVNLWIIVAVAVFLAGTAAVVMWLAGNA